MKFWRLFEGYALVGFADGKFKDQEGIGMLGRRWWGASVCVFVSD